MGWTKDPCGSITVPSLSSFFVPITGGTAPFHNAPSEVGGVLPATTPHRFQSPLRLKSWLTGQSSSVSLTHGDNPLAKAHEQSTRVLYLPWDRSRGARAATVDADK